MNRAVKLIHLLRVPRYRQALRHHRVAAAVEHAKSLTPLGVRTVIDVGANRGQFALFALQQFPAARVISIEPLREPADVFRSLFSDEPRVTLFRRALAPTSGNTIMHVSRHDDSSSLLPITATQSTIFAGTEEVGTESVTTAILTELVGANDIVSPALLKLDVQGYELEALHGCGALLECFDFVCLEGSFVELYEGQALADEVIAFLRSAGFAMTKMYGTVSDAEGRAIQADMLFVSRRIRET